MILNEYQYLTFILQTWFSVHALKERILQLRAQVALRIDLNCNCKYLMKVVSKHKISREIDHFERQLLTMPTLALPEMREENDLAWATSELFKPTIRIIHFVVPINGNRHESLLRFLKTWQKLRSKDQNVELTISLMDSNSTSLLNTIDLVNQNSKSHDGVKVFTSRTTFSRGPALQNGLR